MTLPKFLSALSSISLLSASICLPFSSWARTAADQPTQTLQIKHSAFAALPSNWLNTSDRAQQQELLIQQFVQNHPSANWLTGSAAHDVQALPSLSAAVKAPAVLSVQLVAARYDTVSVTTAGFAVHHAWLDGAEVKLDAALTLTPGEHQLLLHTTPTDAADKLVLQSQYPLRQITQPEQISEQRMQQQLKINQLDISPDGQYMVVNQTVPGTTTTKPQSQVQLWRQRDKTLLQQWTTPPSQWLFSNDSTQLVTVQALPDSTVQSVEFIDLRTLQRRYLSIPQSVSLQRFVDANHLVVSQTHSAEFTANQLRHLKKPADRFAKSRDEQVLLLMSTDDGLLHPLDKLPVDASVVDISPNGQQWLVQHSIPSTEFPFTESSVLQLYAPATATLVELGTFRQLDQVAFADDSSLLLIAGPNFANGLGKHLTSVLRGQNSQTPAIANDYDGQLYRFNLATRQITALSTEFDPGIIFMYPQRAAGRFVLWATDQDHNRLFSFDLTTEKFQLIKTSAAHIDQVAVATNSSDMLWVGSDAMLPPRWVWQHTSEHLWYDWAQSLPTQGIATVHDELYSHPQGHQIPAHWYQPTHFDPQRKYPLIVYYYGGTIPESKRFYGPYPFQQWANAGYVVLVVQPRGAVGYGQWYSAFHPNDWGQAAGDDIVTATEAFVASHPFVNAQRIGHIGASYGGFMTMYLASHSQLFKAGVAHAGISTISSYWGQGRWGIGYSAVASHDSYPWNNPTLYSQQSPLFHADKVQEALLLTAGDADDNVPYGESIQMYNALKILGKDVEMVSVPAEAHSIRDPQKRLQWLMRIQAFFDKHLKDQPQWWQALEQQG